MPSALIPALTTDVVNPYLRGRTGALTSIARVGGTALAPILFGVIADYTGLRAALILVMPATIIGAFIVLPALRTYPPDAEYQQSESVRQHRLETEEARQAAMATAATGDGTEATCSQSVDVGFWIPGPIRRMAEAKALRDSVEEFRKAVETRNGMA